VTLDVDPGELRLPPSRRSGADPMKLAEQIRHFGDRTAGMPALQVTKGAREQLMINDGVTRASRIAKLRPRATIQVEVIDERPSWSLEHLPRVRETL
jgi:hypothetical protein